MCDQPICSFLYLSVSLVSAYTFFSSTGFELFTFVSHGLVTGPRHDSHAFLTGMRGRVQQGVLLEGGWCFLCGPNEVCI